jgi:chromosome segregation ATPase
VTQELVEQAREAIRGGVKELPADRLHGDVQVVHWSAIQEAIEALLAEQERKTSEIVEKLRRTPAELNKELEDKVVRLEAEVARLKAQVGELKRALDEVGKALDFVELVDDFSLEDFEMAAWELATQAEQLDKAYAETGKPVGLAGEVAAIVDDARRVSEDLKPLVSKMNENQAELRDAVAMIKVGKECDLLWRRLDMAKEKAGLLTKVLG